MHTFPYFTFKLHESQVLEYWSRSVISRCMLFAIHLPLEPGSYGSWSSLLPAGCFAFHVKHASKLECRLCFSFVLVAFVFA